MTLQSAYLYGFNTLVIIDASSFAQDFSGTDLTTSVPEIVSVVDRSGSTIQVSRINLLDE